MCACKDFRFQQVDQQLSFHELDFTQQTTTQRMMDVERGHAGVLRMLRSHTSAMVAIAIVRDP
jgi:hypothetical protein